MLCRINIYTFAPFILPSWNVHVEIRVETRVEMYVISSTNMDIQTKFGWNFETIHVEFLVKLCGVVPMSLNNGKYSNYLCYISAKFDQSRSTCFGWKMRLHVRKLFVNFLKIFIKYFCMISSYHRLQTTFW